MAIISGRSGRAKKGTKTKTKKQRQYNRGSSNEGKYSVYSENGRGELYYGGAETPLGAKRKAMSAIRELDKEGDKSSSVYVSYYRPSDGQHAYLNPDGHSISGHDWRKSVKVGPTKKSKKAVKKR